jgi:hypothetical protein
VIHLGKNVYSLVLSEEVVNAIDRIAFEQGKSRSGMINQILSQYLSFPTPEDTIREIFGCIENSICKFGSFKTFIEPSENVFSLRTPLQFRYHPAVKYSIELYPDNSSYIGELRVLFRTQNSELLDLSLSFFVFWKKLEEKYLGKIIRQHSELCSICKGKYTRKLLRPDNLNEYSSEETANIILEYIKELDTNLKTYFSYYPYTENGIEEIAMHYADYLENAVII